MAETNVVTEHPPTVAGVIAAAAGATATILTDVTSGSFDGYDAAIVGACIIAGGIIGKIAERWTQRFFPS